MNPTEYELLVADYFKKRGYRVALTPAKRT